MTEPIVEFIRYYIEKEFEAITALHTERDEQVFQQKVAVLRAYLGEGMEPKITRPSEVDDAFFEEGQQIMEAGFVRPRTLFQIKEYLAPPYQRLYRAYLSLPLGSPTRRPSYTVNYFLIPDRDTFKIISEYHFDNVPDKPRMIRVKLGGLTWIWRGGVKLHTLGMPAKCWKFQAPSKPEHLAEYEAE